MYHAAVRSNLIKDKDKFAIKVKLLFPNFDLNQLKKKLNNKKYFYLKKRMTEEEKEKIWALGEKGIVFEPFQSRIYPHAESYSHVLGQIDNDNYGISGIENYFDKELKDINKEDLVGFTPSSEYEFIVNGERLYRVLTNSISIKYERQGNEKEYNPSWT